MRDPQKTRDKFNLFSFFFTLQVRCGDSGRWFRLLRAMADRALLRWSSGNPVLSDPATVGSTAPGLSVG